METTSQIPHINPLKAISFMALLLLIMLWLYTGMDKILENEKFVFQMGLSPLGLVAYNNQLLGWVVPVIELALACALAIEKTRRVGLFASIFLLFVFEFYIAAMLLSHSELPCACGGVVALMSWRGHLLFNLFFIACAAGHLYFEYPRVRKRE